MRLARFCLFPLTSALIASLLAGPAAAQAPQPQPPKDADPAKPLELPPPPTIDDPMLNPIPAAAQTVATWEEALAQLKTRSTDLRVAYAEVKRAEAQSRVALAGALTMVNANASFTHQLITREGLALGTTSTISLSTPQSDIFSGSITVNQPLFAPAVWHNIKTARVNQEVAALSAEDLKRVLAANVASAIVAVVTSERIAELNRVGLRRALERHALTLRKKNLGGATGLDVIRAQQDVETARATLVTGDETLRQSRESLGLALGVASPVGVTRDINLDGLEKSALRICRVAPSLDERADVVAARKRVEIARRNGDNVKYQFLPTLSAQSTLASTTAYTGSSPPTTWNIQALLSIPLWEGGARYGQLRANRAVEEQAEQNLESLKRTATIQVAQAHRAVGVAEASRKVASDSRALAAETDRLTRVGWQEGQGTSLELVVAAGNLRQAEITLALREFEVTRARILSLLTLASCPW